MLIWSVSPVAFNICGLSVYWYGVIYGLSLVSSWGVVTCVLRRMRRENAPVPSKSVFDDFMFFAIIFMLIGARLGHVLFFELEYYMNNLFEILMIRNGGLSFHGGVIGLAIYIFIKRHHFRWKIMMDILCFAGALGVGIGRIANFFNQELYGKACFSDFAIIFQMVDNIPRYPTQLFESFFEGILNFWLLFIVYKFKGIKIIGQGKISSIFIIIYSSSRFFIEFYKDVEIFGYFNGLTLTVGQILCLPLFLFGVLLPYIFNRTKSF